MVAKDEGEQHLGERDVAPVSDAGARERGRSEELGAKLQLTALALGCPTVKELSARFARVNARTSFTPANAYKWAKGKALPRSASVYDDWAELLGEGFTGQFIAASSFQAFAEALAEAFYLPADAVERLGADLPSLSQPAEQEKPSPGEPVTPHWSGDQVLLGEYLAVSPAWSAARAGELIVGVASIEREPDGALRLTYLEQFFGQQVRMEGPLVLDRRAAQAFLTCSMTARLFLMSLQLPSLPANLIGGMLSGTALHDPDARPMACGLVLVRSHRLEWKSLLARSRYEAAQAEAVAKELVALGYEEGPALTELSSSLLRSFEESARGMLFRGRVEEMKAIALQLDNFAPA